MFKTLMYHYISDNISHPMCVSEKKFYEQIKYLKDAGYKFLSLQEVEEAIFNSRPCDNSVFITFDDCYKNTFDTALPILNEFDAKATVSICSSYINEETCPKHTIHMSQEFGRVSDILNWMECGNDIAAHTCNHLKLSHLSNKKVDEEVCMDKQILEKIFDKEISCFFYPFGSVNDYVEKVVSEQYRLAFVTDQGSKPSPENLFRIGRIYIAPDWSLDEFINSLSEGDK